MGCQLDVLSVSMRYFSTNFVTAVVLALTPLAKAVVVPQDAGSGYTLS